MDQLVVGLHHRCMGESEVWTTSRDLWVEVILDGSKCWVWTRPRSGGEWMVIPAGTRVSAPYRVWAGLRMGAYVCDYPPDDERDHQWWTQHRLLEPVGPLRPGAVIEI